ncbi:unnamed protein product [Camellia sinensis]
MEQTKGLNQGTLINELIQGLELTKQLKNNLDPLASSPESCEFLIQKILSSYDKALSILNLEDSVGELHQIGGHGGSPKSEDFKVHCHKDVYKKRERHCRDGLNKCAFARKQGLFLLKMAIVGENMGRKTSWEPIFQESYYRCTHRHAQGCLATRLVQKSDKDPSIFEITYRGRHTCIQTSQVIPALASIGNEGSKQNRDENQSQSQELLFEFGAGHTVKIEDLGLTEETFTSFSFPSTPIESENVETNIILDSVKENNFLGSDSRAFFSPETSESDLFSVFPCQMDDFGLSQIQHSKSDFSEMISALVANSSIGSLDFSLNQADFEPNFSFDTSEFFA